MPGINVFTFLLPPTRAADCAVALSYSIHKGQGKKRLKENNHRWQSHEREMKNLIKIK